MIGGILLNSDGKVLSSGVGGIAWLDPADGSSGTLIDAFENLLIPGVNEMFPDRYGGLYFGALDLPALTRREEMKPWGMFQLRADGQTTLVADGIRFPNGIALSPDGAWLYCNETYNATMAYELGTNGVAGSSRRLLSMDDADGLALDVAGDIWSVGYETGEIMVLAPDGTLRERIATPAEGITNIRFGGEDLRDVFISATCPEAIPQFQRGDRPTTRGSRIYRARSYISGLQIEPTCFWARMFNQLP